MTDCIDKYQTTARGADCYCTAFVGCFHRHFVVKPTVPSNGLQGVHDADYFIEVVATNKAQLQTVAQTRVRSYRLVDFVFIKEGNILTFCILMLYFCCVNRSVLIQPRPMQGSLWMGRLDKMRSITSNE